MTDRSKGSKSYLEANGPKLGHVYLYKIPETAILRFNYIGIAFMKLFWILFMKVLKFHL